MIDGDDPYDKGFDGLLKCNETEKQKLLDIRDKEEEFIDESSYSLDKLQFKGLLYFINFAENLFTNFQIFN